MVFVKDSNSCNRPSYKGGVKSAGTHSCALDLFIGQFIQRRCLCRSQALKLVVLLIQLHANLAIPRRPPFIQALPHPSSLKVRAFLPLWSKQEFHFRAVATAESISVAPSL